MHELSITQGILNNVTSLAKENNYKKVMKIFLVAGEIYDYDPKWIQYYFNIVSKGTIAENAKISLEVQKLKFQCNDCGNSFTLNIHSDDHMVCPNCQSSNYKMISGRDFFIKGMEVE